MYSRTSGPGFSRPRPRSSIRSNHFGITRRLQVYKQNKYNERWIHADSPLQGGKRSVFSLASAENCLKRWAFCVAFSSLPHHASSKRNKRTFPHSSRLPWEAAKEKMPASRPPQDSTNSTNTRSNANVVTMVPRLPSRTADGQMRAINKKTSARIPRKGP